MVDAGLLRVPLRVERPKGRAEPSVECDGALLYRLGQRLLLAPVWPITSPQRPGIGWLVGSRTVHTLRTAWVTAIRNQERHIAALEESPHLQQRENHASKLRFNSNCWVGKQHLDGGWWLTKYQNNALPIDFQWPSTDRVLRRIFPHTLVL